ncbi:hypothetical protein BEP19_00280 [Ammoniphilus oxalaticus]|uniref:TVP38/TMEM64 family membrane protein n=1 Tax=Ammoniphilus oxalaticus TaxID=66863 RepID=A0A419SRC1_9BACL|nr:TVP38/TMEM64 family protein [Ammoniphilus oxalaticus]RKD27045.1 hypothetical protein BEP19_00280 [Ammoniphilus oxalaticus]
MNLDVEDILQWIEAYQRLGVIVAFLLPVIEAFIPALPLIAIATGSAAAFGLWKGFLFTWLGACAGSILVFWLVRKLRGTRTHLFFRKYRTIVKTTSWFENRGFSVLFLLRCFPFSPSSLINVLAALSRLPFHTYFWATLLGKGVMIFIISFIGADLPAMLREPWKLLFIALLIAALWLFGKRVEKQYISR